MNEAKGIPTFEAIQRIIYDHTGEPEQVHMDGSKCHPRQEDPEWSVRTTVWLPNENAAQYSFAEPPLDSRLTPKQWKKYDPPEFVF